MANAYVNHDLRHSNIRVLDLDVTRFRKDGFIRGDLRVVSLDNSAFYEALSYCWAGLPSHEIICSGKRIRITANCYDALKSLLSNFNTTTIWVDSICINQQDEAEKSHQVPLMRDIYGKARRVYVWLGGSTEKSDRALGWIKDDSPGTSPLLLMKFKSFPACMKPNGALKVFKVLPELMSHYPKRKKWNLLYSPGATRPPSEDMEDLFSRGWFTRMWTIQELVMANEPVVVCGNKSVRWNNLHGAIIEARESSDIRNNKNFSMAFHSVLTAEALWLILYQKAEWTMSHVRLWRLGNAKADAAWQRLLDFLETYGPKLARFQLALFLVGASYRLYSGLRPLKSWPLAFITWSYVLTRVLTPALRSRAPLERPPWEVSLRYQLPGVLNKIRKRQATEPADKVYALYGLLQELEIQLGQPDYGLPVYIIYLRFTCRFIEWNESLAILADASGKWTLDAPPWVPDWSKPHSRIVEGRAKAAGDSRPNFQLLPAGARDGIVRSNGSSPSQGDDANDVHDAHRIKTKAAIIDEAKFCTSTVQEHGDSLFDADCPFGKVSPAFAHNMDVFKQWLTLSLLPEFLGNREGDDFLGALFDMIHSETDFNVEVRSELLKCFRDFTSMMYVPSPEAASGVYSPLECARTLSLQRNESVLKYYRGRCDAIAGKRVFFKTEGNRLGTGPVSMQTGDIVALLAGFRYPMILRRKGPNYEVVGIAYIDGVMDGQAWPTEETEIAELVLI